MNKILLCALALLLSSNTRVHAQSTNYIWYAIPWDSTYFHFDSVDIGNMVTDGSGLWQIGTTTKPFFSAGNSGTRTLMTDTVDSYPVSANAWLLAPVTVYSYTTLSFWHKYETTPGHDGGIVEISSDNGNSWDNIKGMCNLDTLGGYGSGVLTDNFYDFDDTLATGEPAFSGTSNGWQHSRFQLFWCCPIKPGKSANWCPIDNILVRFRFRSDDTAESLDGWIIDSLLVEHDMPMSLSVNAEPSLKKSEVFPNPATTELTIKTSTAYRSCTITNSIGQVMLQRQLDSKETKLDIHTLPAGIYYISLKGENGSEVRKFVKL